MTDAIPLWCQAGAAGWQRLRIGQEPREADNRKLEQAWSKLSAITGDER
jgi:hypothetical protein